MTTTLSEARRALLELLELYNGQAIPLSKFNTIAAYLDQQVALNVENLPSQIRGNSYQFAIVDDPIIRGGGSAGTGYGVMSGGGGAGYDHRGKELRKMVTPEIAMFMPDPTFRGNRPTPAGPHVPTPTYEELDKLAKSSARALIYGDNQTCPACAGFKIAKHNCGGDNA